MFLLRLRGPPGERPRLAGGGPHCSTPRLAMPCLAALPAIWRGVAPKGTRASPVGGGPTRASEPKKAQRHCVKRRRQGDYSAASQRRESDQKEKPRRSGAELKKIPWFLSRAAKHIFGKTRARASRSVHHRHHRDTGRKMGGVNWGKHTPTNVNTKRSAGPQKGRD